MLNRRSIGQPPAGAAPTATIFSDQLAEVPEAEVRSRTPQKIVGTDSNWEWAYHPDGLDPTDSLYADDGAFRSDGGSFGPWITDQDIPGPGMIAQVQMVGWPTGAGMSDTGLAFGINTATRFEFFRVRHANNGAIGLQLYYPTGTGAGNYSGLQVTESGIIRIECEDDGSFRFWSDYPTQTATTYDEGQFGVIMRGRRAGFVSGGNGNDLLRWYGAFRVGEMGSF